MKLQNIEEQNDERYLCYRPVEVFRIFHNEVDKEWVEWIALYVFYERMYFLSQRKRIIQMENVDEEQRKGCHINYRISC